MATELASGTEPPSERHELGEGRVGWGLQSIMSRTGSFPLAVARGLLRECGISRPVVLDPFCGKGTSLLAARFLGYPAYGLDVAPEAVVCSAAKLAHITIRSVEEYVERLRWDHGWTDDQIPDSVRRFFHEETLRQIVSVRPTLLSDRLATDRRVRDNATFTLACLLGILHGHSSFSLSVSSSHAYSMAPAYVSRYAAEHGLQPPVRNVKECLLEKARRTLEEAVPPPVESEVRLGSALECSTVFPELVGRVDVILTSPPYLNAQTYAKDNWLRLWVMGWDYRDLRKDYIETGSPATYRELMTRAFEELSTMLKVGGRLVCIAGDVRVRRSKGASVFQTGGVLAEIAATPAVGLRVEGYEEHVVPAHHRYLHAISSSNGHTKRGLVERLFFARKAPTQ